MFYIHLYLSINSILLFRGSGYKNIIWGLRNLQKEKVIHGGFKTKLKNNDKIINDYEHELFYMMN